MTVLIALIVLGIVTWVFRVMFTAAVPADRLPEAVRSRMDVVGTAAFAALLAADLAGTSADVVTETVVAVAAAAIATRLSGSHVVAIGAAVAAWLLVAVVTA